MGLLDFKKSEILKTENLRTTTLWGLWGILSGVFSAFWVTTMFLVRPEELFQWLIFGVFFCILGSLCLAWIFANIYPNIRNGRKKKDEAEGKSDWFEYLLLLYIQIENPLQKPIKTLVIAELLMQYQYGTSRRACSLERIREIVVYLKDRGFVRIGGKIGDGSTNVGIWIRRRGIRKVKKRLSQYEYPIKKEDIANENPNAVLLSILKDRQQRLLHEQETKN